MLRSISPIYHYGNQCDLSQCKDLRTKKVSSPVPYRKLISASSSWVQLNKKMLELYRGQRNIKAQLNLESLCEDLVNEIMLMHKTL